MFSGARALLPLLALAALAVSSHSFAQAPTFNTLITTYKGDPNWAHPAWAAVGDFNGDGKLDSAVTDGTGTVHMLLGTGNGTFSERRIDVGVITTGNAVGLASSFAPFLPHIIDGVKGVRAADVNGDGKLDLVLVMGVHLNFAPLGGVTVMINAGNDASGVPQFTTSAHYFAPNFDTRSITVGDLNGDGRPEFIVGNANSPIWTWLNNGDGTFIFNNATAFSPSAGNPAVNDGVIADVNGDGKADFVVTSGQAGATDIFLGNGDGTFQAPLVIPGATSTVAVADLNKDGKLDLILNTATGAMSVALGNGNGTFGAPVVYSNGVAGGGVTSLAVADINGDGNLDVVAGVSLGVPGKVAVFLGDGSGTLGTPYVFDSTSVALAVVAADFTGDGKPDIGSVGFWDDTYGVLTNTTVFAPPLPTQTLTILGGNGSFGAVAANVEYYNPATGNWQPAYLVGQHPWGEVAGTDSWINYEPDIHSDPGAGPTTNQTLWYLYRVRFTVPSDAINPKMTFSLKADNFAQVAINGVAAGGSTQFINFTSMNNVIVGTADQLNADAVFSQNVHPGENTITLNVGDWGGANGFNFRIDLSMQSSQPLEIVPAAPADNTPPVITAPANIIVEATGPSGAVVNFTATAQDNVNGPVSVVASKPSGSTFALGTTTVSLTATDAAGNTGTASFTVTVRDTTPPAIAAPAALTAEATGPAGAAVTFAATATDLVGGSVPVTANPASGSTFPVGFSSVSLSATDAAGNTASGTILIRVQDTIAPLLTLPADQTIEATSAAGAVATFSATATDAVGVTLLSYSAASGSTFAIGATTVAVTAKDAAGNSSSGSFTITVRDTTAPAIATASVSPSVLWPPNHKMVNVAVTANAADVVGVTSLKIISIASNEPINGLGDGDQSPDWQITGSLTAQLRAERSGKGTGRIYTITIEARDAAGNSSTTTLQVSVPRNQGKENDDVRDSNRDKNQGDDRKDN